MLLCFSALKPAFAALADVPLDESGTTYRKLILQQYPQIRRQRAAV